MATNDDSRGDAAAGLHIERAPACSVVPARVQEDDPSTGHPAERLPEEVMTEREAPEYTRRRILVTAARRLAESD